MFLGVSCISRPVSTSACRLTRWKRACVCDARRRLPATPFNVPRALAATRRGAAKLAICLPNAVPNVCCLKKNCATRNTTSCVRLENTSQATCDDVRSIHWTRDSFPAWSTVLGCAAVARDAVCLDTLSPSHSTLAPSQTFLDALLAAAAATHWRPLLSVLNPGSRSCTVALAVVFSPIVWSRAVRPASFFLFSVLRR